MAKISKKLGEQIASLINQIQVAMGMVDSAMKEMELSKGYEWRKAAADVDYWRKNHYAARRQLRALGVPVLKYRNEIDEEKA